MMNNRISKIEPCS